MQDNPDIQEVNVQLGKQPITNVRKLDILRTYVNQDLFLLLFQNRIACKMIMTITVQLLHQRIRVFRVFRVTSTVLTNDTYKAGALIDSGCTDKSFISKRICNLLNLKITASTSIVGMASAALSTQSHGYCNVSLMLGDQFYKKVKLHMLEEVCTDIIFGIDFQELHENITINYGGSKPPLSFIALATTKTNPPELFAHLNNGCKPTASKSRKHSKNGQEFIKAEVHFLAEAKIMEPSNSPWRAQVLVIHRKTKRRMEVENSETINQYTLLDAYPPPKIDEMVNTIAKYKYYSTIDLLSAYYQIPLSEKDKPYTAFEADGKL